MNEKGKKELEAMFLDIISESLSATKEAIENNVVGTWLLDGGLGDWLIKAGKVYDSIMDINTIDEKNISKSK